MAGLGKPKFKVLDITGANYLEWCVDVEITLEGKGLLSTIQENNQESSQNKAKALMMIRRHLCDNLRTQYLIVREPRKLWVELKERFDHSKTVIEPEALNDWHNIRLQDYISVADFNSELFEIVTKLRLCGRTITDKDMIEKTLSTMHADNSVLHTQYRHMKFEKHGELISLLLAAEKHNKVLLKNHEARPTGSKALPEANASTSHPKRQWRGRGRGRGRGGRRGPSIQHNRPLGPIKDKGKRSFKKNEEDMCYRCGDPGHWVRTCRTPKHLVDLYQASLKKKRKSGESHAIEADFEANAIVAAIPPEDGKGPVLVELEKHLEVSDFMNMD